MINTLTITNFQSHEHTILDFDDGINIIIGQSDSGKSAILRALRWVIENKPSGEAFRSNWGGETKALLIVDKTKTVSRYKSKTFNAYDSGNTTYKSFGQDVPQDIKELLNFSSLNIAGQFDSPFLLAMSGGEVAKYLNSIVHLDKIDSSIASINSTLRQEKQVLETTKGYIEELEKREKSFSYLDEAEKLCDELEGLDNELCDSENKQKLLSDTLVRIERCQGELEEYSDLGGIQHEVYKVELAISKVDSEEKELNDLKETLGTITDIETELDWCKIKLKEDQDKFDELMPSRCPLCGRSGK